MAKAVLDKRLPLVVITGPTASGKTGIAIKLAEKFNGEIVCADSRTVYRGLDIGTAKPTKVEQAKIKHHLLDVAEPDERFTLKNFQELASTAIADIRQRGKTPFLVGGSGLYIDSIVLDYQLDSPADLGKRAELEILDIESLQQVILDEDLSIPENMLNKRQLIRTIERGGINKKYRTTPDKNTVVVQIATPKVELERRITKRAVQIFRQGVSVEAKGIASKYGWDNPAMSGNIYPIIHRMLDGQLTEAEATEEFIRSDRRLVKKQLTWLRRHKFVQSLSLREVEDYITREIEHRKKA